MFCHSDTAWAFIRAKNGPFILPDRAVSPARHDFILATARNLPQSMQKEAHYFLTRPPDCHCQRMLRSGELDHTVNIVECERLRDAADNGENNDGLLFHASVPVFSGNRAIGIMNFAMKDWQASLSGSPQDFYPSGTMSLRSK